MTCKICSPHLPTKQTDMVQFLFVWLVVYVLMFMIITIVTTSCLWSVLYMHLKAVHHVFLLVQPVQTGTLKTMNSN